MARKRPVFFRAVESFLKRLLILFLLGILFTAGRAPVLSQRPASHPISQSWADARELEELGRKHYYDEQFNWSLDYRFDPIAIAN